MGNLGLMSCPGSEIQQLSSLALDICPVPSYAPNPLVNDMLMTPNASLHLSDRYGDVQNSLSPSELAHFTRRLRTTFGREGKVTMGGVGVVALALAVLFDTLAKEVKGQWVPESGPISGLFLQEPGRKPYPTVLLVSDYLRLVPHIANNPARMREETEKCLHRLEGMQQTYPQTMKREGLGHVDRFNSDLVQKIVFGLQQHHKRLSNSTRYDAADFWWLSSSPLKTKSSLNCDLDAGNKAFEKEVLKSKEIMEELKRCGINPEVNASFFSSVPDNESVFFGIVPDMETVFNTQSNPSGMNKEYFEAWIDGDLVAPEEDFDLKAKSHLPF